MPIHTNTCNACLVERIRLAGGEVVIGTIFVITNPDNCELELDYNSHPQPESVMCDCCGNDIEEGEEALDSGNTLCYNCFHVQTECLTGSESYGSMETCGMVGHELA